MRTVRTPSGASFRNVAAQPGPEQAVEVTELVVRFGDTVAVDGLSFDAPMGAVTALLGPNGAGKTTTVETLEGFRRPDGGEVRVLGLDPVRDHRRLVPQIGVMLQEGGVYTGIRPIEILRLYASYYEHPHDPGELLEQVGLADRARTTWRHLSGGERQRLSLALALVGRPRVVFLDEPTAGIDPAGRQIIRRVVAELRDQGVGVLLTTHDLDDAQRLADRVLIIDRGRLLASGTPAELMTAGQSPEIRFAAPSGLDTVALSARLGSTVVEEQPGEYLVSAEATPDTVAALTSWLAEHGIPLGDLRAGRGTLEDVFLRLTREGRP
ncbi:ABC transporter ATP-binding protein [Rhabdothermincola sp.]|uniref:ABC transporter ATP-binding protein n=1 Tax=Rhabdothermincola sp. TaxID=2820405 RepID=UPI003FA6CA6D